MAQLYLESQLGKGSQAVSLLHAWDFKDYTSRFLFIIPGWMQTDIIISLWPNCRPDFLLMLFVLSCKTWNVNKPGAWLASPLQELNSHKISPSSYLYCSKSCAHSRQSLTVRAVSRQVRSNARGLPALYSFNFPNTSRHPEQLDSLRWGLACLFRQSLPGDSNGQPDLKSWFHKPKMMMYLFPVSPLLLKKCPVQ